MANDVPVPVLCTCGGWRRAIHKPGYRMICIDCGASHDAGAEHHNAALRERLTALARSWDTAADALQPSVDPHAMDSVCVLAQRQRDFRCRAIELRALLTEPPKAQHPNPLCPHTLECLCDESEAHDDVFGPSGILNNGAARKEGQ
jgi:hypothetical protein